MGLRYLLDTNVVLDFMAKNLPENSQNTVAKIIDDEINISLITKIHKLTIATRNIADFKDFENLPIWNPWLCD